MATVLVVDDESSICKGLRKLLEAEGYCVETARDGEEALAKFDAVKPDIVLLDVMMPKMNGFKVCERLRAKEVAAPIIFLTAKDGEVDQIRGFGLGADDYLAKDVPEAVLLARIERACARAKEERERLETAIAQARQDRIELGTVTVDLNKLTVCEHDKEIARLTTTESGMLQQLCRRRGRVVTIEDLIAKLRGEGFACSDTLIYTHISRLRGKLGSAAGWLKTVPSVGYLVDGEDDETNE